MDNTNDKALATAATIRDVIYLLFAVYAFYSELTDFTIMANLAIVIPHCASAIYEIRNDRNRNMRKLLELICFCISFIDIALIMTLGKTMQNSIISGIISISAIIIVCSMVGIFRSFMSLIADYRDADFGINLPKIRRK